MLLLKPFAEGRPFCLFDFCKISAERCSLPGCMQLAQGFHEPGLQFAFAARVFPAADGGRAGSDAGGEFLDGQVHFSA